MIGTKLFRTRRVTLVLLEGSGLRLNTVLSSTRSHSQYSSDKETHFGFETVSEAEKAKKGMHF